MFNVWYSYNVPEASKSSSIISFVSSFFCASLSNPPQRQPVLQLFQINPLLLYQSTVSVVIRERKHSIIFMTECQPLKSLCFCNSY